MKSPLNAPTNCSSPVPLSQHYPYISGLSAKEKVHTCIHVHRNRTQIMFNICPNNRQYTTPFNKQEAHGP